MGHNEQHESPSCPTNVPAGFPTTNALDSHYLSYTGIFIFLFWGVDKYMVGVQLLRGGVIACFGRCLGWKASNQDQVCV